MDAGRQAGCIEVGRCIDRCSGDGSFCDDGAAGVERGVGVVEQAGAYAHAFEFGVGRGGCRNDGVALDIVGGAVLDVEGRAGDGIGRASGRGRG